MGRRTEIAILLVILGVAAALRFSGISWGLPHPYHPDEGSILFHALAFGTGDLNPHWFRWPSLFMYGMFGVYGIYYVIGRIAGLFGAPMDLIRSYLTDPTPFWLMGRTVSALAGVATVWVTWLIGRRSFGRFYALVAAAILAVTYLHVRDSHYATPDVVTTFLASVSLLLAVAAADTGRLRTLVLSGLLAGLAASAKYPGVLAFAGTAAAFVLLARRGRIGSVGLFAPAVAGVVGFVAGTPFSVLSPSEFARDIAMQFGMVSSSGGPAIPMSFTAGLAEIVTKSLGRGVGYPVLILAALGVLAPLVVGRRGRVDLAGDAAGDRRRSAHPATAIPVVLAYALAVLVVMSLLTVKRSTYLTPALPAIAVLAAGGLSALFRASGIPRRNVAAAVVAVALVIFACIPSVRFDRALAAPDTRTVAQRWMEQNIPAGSRIALETYGPVLNPSTAQLELLAGATATDVETWQGPKRRLAEMRLEAGRKRAPQYEVYGIDWWDEPFSLPDPWNEPVGLAAAVESLGIRYVVLTSKAQQYRDMAGAEQPRVATTWAFVDWLHERAELLRRFQADVDVPPVDRGTGRSFHNPVIEIYEMKSLEGRESMEPEDL